MISATHTFFEKCLAGLMSALLGVFVLLSCCVPVTPACCKREEASLSQFQQAKQVFIAASCCMEQDEHAVLPLGLTPKIKFVSALPALTKVQTLPEQTLSSTNSLLQQAFHKDQSKRYLELGVFLS